MEDLPIQGPKSNGQNHVPAAPHHHTRASSPPTVVVTDGLTKDLIVVGVDLGTIYSTVALAHSAARRAPEEIDVITSWPGGLAEKIPSEITYEEAGPRIPRRRSSLSRQTAEQRLKSLSLENDLKNVRWGLSIPQSEPRLQCMKLFLDPTKKLPAFAPSAESARLLKRYDRNVTDVTTDFLTQLYRHTMQTLRIRYGDTSMLQTAVQFVLTVPASWSDAAKYSILNAAEKSGFGSRRELQLINEPEAAALHALNNMGSQLQNAGDTFILCDAGGASVDVVAYRIKQLCPLKIEEATVSSSGMCGSAALNHRFEQYIRNRMGDAMFRGLREKMPQSWRMCAGHFEDVVKKDFREDDPLDAFLPLPGIADDAQSGLRSGFLVVTTSELKSIFDPVVDDIIRLIVAQARQIHRKGGNPSAIVLVGGFAKSAYLKSRLESYFLNFRLSTSQKSQHDKQKRARKYKKQESSSEEKISLEQKRTSLSLPIKVLHPDNAWTAVARGAVLKGLEGSPVVSRKARWHYGTSYATVFDERRHAMSDRYWSPFFERWMVGDLMQWHIAKGQSIHPNQPLSFRYTRNFRPSDHHPATPSAATTTTTTPSTERPPPRPASSSYSSSSRASTPSTIKPTTSNPTPNSNSDPNSSPLIVRDNLIVCSADRAPQTFREGPDMFRVCTLVTDLTSVPKERFMRLTTRKGVEFDHLDFELLMWWGDESRGSGGVWGNGEAAQGAKRGSGGAGGANGTAAAKNDEANKVRSAAEDAAWEAKRMSKGAAEGQLRFELCVGGVRYGSVGMEFY
ncbi:MAG: hypothetical protein M1831_006171 [Alyxoria varia]|nr:MAG: hypothetical protein M1831_006171 [Alyxoria varia]